MWSLLYTFLFILQASLIFGKAPMQLVCAVGNATCLLAETRDMFASLVDGSSSLHTEPFDPMFVDYLHIDESFKIDTRDNEVNGLKNAVIEEASVDMSQKFCRMRFVSDFVLKGQYVTSGSLVSMPIEGKGSFTLKYRNVNIEMTMPFDIIKDAVGNDVMILKSHSYTYDVRDGAEFFFDNLYFGKNKTASDAIHKAMNENWKALTIEFGKYLLDPVNAKIFNSMLIYARALPLKEYLQY